jgi:hypothetical protein
MPRPRRSLCRALIFRTGGTSLTIAQRFNAGLVIEVKLEFRRERKKFYVVPMGLNKEKFGAPALNARGIFSPTGIYETADRF